MTHNKILSDLKAKKFDSIYFLAGEETFYMDLISDYIEKNVLSEADKGFNQTIFYGRDIEIGALISAAKQFPMMSDHTVIIVKEAQDLKKIEELKSYIEQPLESTLLVLCYRGKKLDKRKALYKSLQKNGIYFESNKLYENKIPEWIKSFLRAKDYKIDDKSAAMLTEFLGKRPEGWYTGRNSPNTRRLIIEEGGFLYDSDAYDDDLPYWANSFDTEKKHLIIPYTLDVNDMRFASPQGFNSGDQFFNYLKDSFDALYKEGEISPKMMSVGMHARILGRPGRIMAMRRFLEYIKTFDNVWLCSRRDIADHWYNNF